VLLSDEIKHYAEKYYMVYPFKECNLKPAGIRLCLGSEYARGGKLMKLYSEPDKDELVIPPFDVAIISTEEVINLPRFIIARWNLRVSLVYEGLLWTGALQVDPGWCGPLFCPISEH
jgi:deoxycytidine triphosphate deaminase